MQTTLIILGIAGLLIVGGFYIARSWGRASAQRDIAEKGVDDARKGQEIDEDVARMPNADLDKRLRKRR